MIKHAGFETFKKGSVDFDNPQKIDCLSSIASSPVDLTGNDYPVMFICCHRSDERNYTSVTFACDNFRQMEIEAQTPNKTSLGFSARYGAAKQEARDAKWSIPDESRIIALDPPKGTRFMRYRACF